MKKVFLMPQFGEPFEWTQQFIDHVQHLEEFGWYWKIFTPNKFESKGNVEIIPMTVEEFNDLTLRATGVKSNLRILPSGRPNFHSTDFIIFLGKIFKEYIPEFTFWGHMGFDNVIGRLDHFVPDSLLEKCDIFSDDVGAFNGNFLLMRNVKPVTDFPFDYLKDWQENFTQEDCPACIGLQGKHTLNCPDEIAMNQPTTFAELKKRGIRFSSPEHFPQHSQDRLENHRPEVKLRIEEDGSLWELLEDVDNPGWALSHKYFGREIPCFHFQMTKKFPKFL